MSHNRSHPYQIVDPSPWPLIASVGTFIMLLGGALAMHGYTIGGLVLGFFVVIIAAIAWWRDVIKEGNHGAHTSKVQLGLRIGMVLFIISELLFFAAFFTSYFYAALLPMDAANPAWPPSNIIPIDPFHLPYLNTLILLLSGTTVTWAHHALLEGKKKEVFQGLVMTVALGLIFTVIQGYEYYHATFSMADGVYGSNFYMATGFHGVHVIIGTTFLAVCAYRAWKGTLTREGHIGFEAAAWYWHFVDVVWLFLFISIYWWGEGPLY